jgi:PD-(D/E)XK nuclease superfamily
MICKWKGESLKTVTVGPVYPPYQTDEYQQCPLYWDLRKRWRKREQKVWTATLIGKAVAHGLELCFGGSLQDPYLAAAEMVRQEYLPGSDRSLRGTLELTRLGLELALGTKFALTRVLAVETPYGRTRPDLVALDYDGALVVIDHKVKVMLDGRFLAKELEKFNRSNQFFEYAWMVGQEHGEPVSRVIAHMIILGPSPQTLLHPVEMAPEHVAHWLHGVAKDWRQMKLIEDQVVEPQARFTACVTSYGPCEMYEGCHTYYGDESAFPALYEQIGSKRAG